MRSDVRLWTQNNKERRQSMSENPQNSSTLSPVDYQRIINTLAAQKAEVEVRALEWQVRYEAATAALAEQATLQEGTAHE